jgi:Methyltransferase domain
MYVDRYLEGQNEWATSLANSGEIMLSCLDAAGARSVAEIGAYAGELTRMLCDWAAEAGAAVTAVDPAPQGPLMDLAEERPNLELVRATSADALAQMDIPDAVVIDGDHNHWTVSRELALLSERAPGPHLPLVLLHDVGWPHGRRDDYFDPDLIPTEHRHPLAGEGTGLVPGEPGTVEGGLPYPRSAREEGGPANGVRTAVEDFAAEREGLRFAVVPAFFGLGVLWDTSAPWAAQIEGIVAPWDDNPLLARLEAQRVRHLAEVHTLRTRLAAAEERIGRQEAVLRRLLESSAMAVAERLSRLRERSGVARSQSVVSKDEIRRALED